MIRRIFPSPILSLALVALWMLLNGSFGLGQWIMGVLLAWLVPYLTHSLRPTPVRFSHPMTALRLFIAVGADVIASNLRVLRGTIAPTNRVPQGGFVVVPLDLRDANGLAVLAAIMCVIPGTIWSELALDRSALLVHLFDMKDAQAEIELIKRRYERPLMEIFE
ncbi:Na+/H+ antiporter subunit E [Hydrogenophaga sp. IBVHS1]|jgi:multicomponent K+:H+ antiporter subunit E|uniref:Na+/H+ antiporter subunit E n=1 Tax=unclassified Hydrogenophaga TaxID=2610897 RepID=UPI000A2ECF6C|nr:Na+/H+ antiporter subunit E [Hydrogenophaga sp. IBVHS1]OSZ76231.1 Na+/H+ antiporter subunit E [Hydrogenophaga sp. IBVHS1]